MSRPLRCDCQDFGCPTCAGDCHALSALRLYRIDMEDRTGTNMCFDCAADAHDTGLYDPGCEGCDCQLNDDNCDGGVLCKTCDAADQR